MATYIKPCSWLILILTWPLSGCLTFNASLQDARVLKEDQSSQVIAAHLVEEVDDERVRKRPFLDLARQFDPNTDLPYFGISYHYRHGWQDEIDYGLSASMGLSGADVKKSLYASEHGALAVGAKLLVPTLSMLYFESYFVGIPFYASIEALDGLSLYFNPAIYYGAARSREEKFAEISTGFVLGREKGVIFEWSTVEDPGGISKFDRYRQFKLGYFWRDSDRGEKGDTLRPKHLALYPELGFAITPLPSVGLLKRWKLDDSWGLELNFSFGYSPLAEKGGEIRRNFARSNLFSSHLRYNAGGEFTLFGGLARRERGSTLETDDGWQRILAVNYGVSVGFGQTFAESEIDWFGVYLPCRCGPRISNWSGLTYGLDEKTPRVARLLRRYEDAPSIQLARYRMYF